MGTKRVGRKVGLDYFIGGSFGTFRGEGLEREEWKTWLWDTRGSTSRLPTLLVWSSQFSDLLPFIAITISAFILFFTQFLRNKQQKDVNLN